MPKPFLYILTGLPYSGKTTLSKELAKRFNFKIATTDELLDEKDYKIEQMTQQDWNFVYAQGYKRLKQKLSEGNVVVFDSGNLKRSERDTARQITESMNIPYQLIYMNISKEEVKKRWLRNQNTKERDDLDKSTLDAALRMFEEPVAQENPILFNPGMDLEQWIKENILHQ